MIRIVIPSSLARRAALSGVALMVAALSPHLALAKPVKPVKPQAAASKSDPPPGKGAPAGAGKPTLVGTFGDWGAYQSQAGKNKICYVLAQPKDRQPTALKRDPAYMFISSRPGEGVHNEVSVIMGFPLKEGGPEAKAEIGANAFDLVAKGENAWIKNAAEEGQFVEAIKKGAKLIVKIASKKGNVTTDTYSLSGISQALERVQKDCP
jgi:hypothetical protein